MSKKVYFCDMGCSNLSITMFLSTGQPQAPRQSTSLLFLIPEEEKPLASANGFSVFI